MWTKQAAFSLVCATTIAALGLWMFQTWQKKSRSRKFREDRLANRRKRQDNSLRQRKLANSKAREDEQGTWTEEQRRERREMIMMQRVEQYQKLDEGMLSGPRVVVDLSFTSTQSKKECNSVLKQLSNVYGYMKRCPLDRLISLHVASCTGQAEQFAIKHGLPHWKIYLHKESVTDIYTTSETVYLSPDASEVLDTVDPETVYVIGGIADRTVRKNESLEKAQEGGYRTARLPLQEHLQIRNPVLNVDSVVIALNEYMNHRDWTRALLKTVPVRKLQGNQR